MLNVIYHGFRTPHSATIISKLYLKYGWLPVCLVGVHLNEENGIEGVPLEKCIISFPRKIRCALFDYSNVGNPIQIDAEILTKLSEFESGYISSLGRFQDPTGVMFGYDERKNYYIDVLTYWNSVLYHSKANLVVFYTWPHTPSCYALYLISKYAHNIKILFIDTAPLLNEHYHLIHTSLEDLSYPLKVLDNVSDDIHESNKIKAKQLGYSQYPDHIVDDFRRYEKSEALPFHFISFVKEKVKLSNIKKIPSLFLSGNIDWKSNHRPYYDIRSRMNSIQYYFFLEKIKYKNRLLKKIYSNKVVVPNLNKKYIYFAAPYQPEAISQIGGANYENVLFTLSILSQICPDDFVIYYKEHPAIFFDKMKGSLKRDSCYYDNLSKFKNIEMVDYNYDQFMLIDHSKAVAVIAGSTAWEAVVRGKTVISFGQGWYSGCKGIIKVTSLQDVKDAIELIVNGYKPNSKDVGQYIDTIKRVAFKFPEHYSRDVFGTDRAELVADEFHKAYKKFYKSE